MQHRIRSGLGALALAATALVVTAPPALANDTCATATPMTGDGTTPYEMGTRTRNGAVGHLPETDVEWWHHSTAVPGRVVSLQAPTGDGAVVTVYHPNCATVLCPARTASPASPTVTCPNPNLPAGTLKIKVTHPGVGDGATAYTLTATGGTTTQCSDGVNNDADSYTDYPYDPHCASYQDTTEAQARVAAQGHITITTDAANVPHASYTGVFADPSKFRCQFLTGGNIHVVCQPVFDAEVSYDCTRFVLSATAPAPGRSGTGNVSGYVACASGPMRTADVEGSGTATTDNVANGTTLGLAKPVHCRAAGVNGGTLPSGSYQVDCFATGAAWPAEGGGPLP